jgi:hypothetical protein
MTWHIKPPPLAMAAPDFLQDEGGSSTNRRNLRRALAAAVAIAAISPLFAIDTKGCARNSDQARPARQHSMQPLAEAPRH